MNVYIPCRTCRRTSWRGCRPVSATWVTFSSWTWPITNSPRCHQRLAPSTVGLHFLYKQWDMTNSRFDLFVFGSITYWLWQLWVTKSYYVTILNILVSVLRNTWIEIRWSILTKSCFVSLLFNINFPPFLKTPHVRTEAARSNPQQPAWPAYWAGNTAPLRATVPETQPAHPLTQPSTVYRSQGQYVGLVSQQARPVWPCIWSRSLILQNRWQL